MVRDCRISLAVHEDTREEWKAAAKDDPHADSMAQLIRTAVTQYIADTDDTTANSIPDDLETQLTDLASQHHDLSRGIDELRGQLDDVREVVDSGVDPETEQLAGDVFDTLPPEDDVTGNQVIEPTGPQPGTIDWLADRIQAPAYRIRAALDYLQESTYAVHQHENQYYKEV